jgi:hypothetical protein
MPLMHGKSPKAFKQNIRTEMHHGKPQKQALAIAYAIKRKAQHKAKGGYMSGHERDEAEQFRELEPEAKSYGMHTSGQRFGKEDVDRAVEHVEGRMKRGELKMAGGGMCAAHGAYACEHCSSEHAAHETAETDHDDDHLISKIMKKHGYSHGGKVSNEEHWTADFEPNEFDVLPHEDDLEFSYTGANSGDYDADQHERHYDDDFISKMLRKRKQHNPRPA